MMGTCALVAALSGVCLYLSAPRQAVWPAALLRARFLCWLSVPLATGAVAAGVQEYGLWFGLSLALSSFLAVLSLLSLLDLRLQRRKLHKNA